MASQQTRLDGRVMDAFEHRLSAYCVGYRQHPTVFLQFISSCEAETAARHAASPAQDCGRGGAEVIMRTSSKRRTV